MGITESTTQSLTPVRVALPFLLAGVFGMVPEEAHAEPEPHTTAQDPAPGSPSPWASTMEAYGFAPLRTTTEAAYSYVIPAQSSKVG